ncbi:MULTISPECIES: hypothetical protein [unclassified Oceanispirochaeta]|uniref:hypothetical protein n=1 Tax=unclassified Oceanispirochaeta TaxID=2635722 RepID=UPI000E09DA55|nr:MULTISPECIES: hypothetical protein [unclassified Oceanispirochaeta]MBF9018940.1 hypothetical protein [Oceanispirochaeta sp. M2]NPD75460.1 hypothetical protein [Oceanispirochaeta sp. M1]RDG28688.1 hypothetical protein DV872_25530 [Oceanispirochaeta sp. M1]
MLSFDEMLQRGDWKSLPHCPGRYILAGGLSALTMAELLGCELTVREYRTPNAPDNVLICELRDGGIISFVKDRQRYIHTLCNAEGFDRKLRQLGIRPLLPETVLLF